MFGLDHFVDQGSGGSEANPALLPAGGYCQAGEEMGFTGAAVTDEDDRLSPADVSALREFVDLLCRDLGIAGEVELLQGFHPRQMRFANAPLHEPVFTFLEFGLQQRFEEAQGGTAFTRRLLGEWTAVRRDCRQA